MGKVYILREPKKDKSWNIYALREASRLKRWFDSVYYSPQLKRLLIVFKPTPGTYVNQLVFEEIGESVLKDAYRMLCPRGCSRCCVVNSGAFILENEVDVLPDEEVRMKIMVQPSEIVRTPGGPIRVYYLATESLGRCVFLSPRTGECVLEKRFGKQYKPIICAITYCTIFAERGGQKYVKTGYRVLRDGRVELYYRRVDDSEFEKAVERMGTMLRKLRRALPILQEHKEEQTGEERQRGRRRMSRVEKLRYQAKYMQRPHLLEK